MQEIDFFSLIIITAENFREMSAFLEEDSSLKVQAVFEPCASEVQEVHTSRLTEVLSIRPKQSMLFNLIVMELLRALCSLSKKG